MKMDSEELQSQENSFIWDENTQLYFHPSSGFYHDPNAGWYYSSRDGLYYKYEDGGYVLLEIKKVDESQINPCGGSVNGDSSMDRSCRKVSHDHNQNNLLSKEDEVEAHPYVAVVHEGNSSGHAGCSNNQEFEENPPPPSAWLEDMLIDFYLSGYNLQNNAVDYQSNPELSANGNNDDEELEEGEWIPEEDFDLGLLAERESDEGYSRDEEIWQAQYGQVIQSSEEASPDIAAVDLWDWKMVTEPIKDGKGHVARLVGRLVKRTAKLHPSMPSGGTLLKTAPICQARLHLVRVTTGQVYKLRNPSVKYLASLSMYDSSNPANDWGFPDISVTWKKSGQKSKSKKGKEKNDCKDSAMLEDEFSPPVKHKSLVYRDRAAERRNLHGGFGVGPGQKCVRTGDVNERLSPEIASTEEAVAQAMDMSFGSNSYARRILGNMGWKEGEALGKTTKGLIEPIQAMGNAGNAGLGYPRGRT